MGDPLDPPEVVVFYNRGDGTFAPPVTYKVGGTNSPAILAVAIGDFNGDGVSDIAVTILGESPPYPESVAVLLSQCP